MVVWYSIFEVIDLKMITKQSLDNLKRNLEHVEKPIKETYTRKEAIEALRPTIRELRKRGFKFQEIAQVISEQSQNELKLRSKEIEDICSMKRRTAIINSEQTQPSLTSNTDKNVSETAESSAASCDEIQTVGEVETE